MQVVIFPRILFFSLGILFHDRMEMMFKKYLVVLFLLVVTVTVPTIIDSELAIKNEEYQQTKNVKFNFSTVDLRNKLSEIQCSRMCSKDSSCLGFGIKEKTTRGVRCFKMKNDSARDMVLPDELIYLKGKIKKNFEVK